MWWMLIIPIFVVGVIYYLYQDNMPWPVYVIPGVVTILLIFLLSILTDYMMASDEEFHGGWVVKAVWDESWTETYTDVKVYTDSDGNTQTRLVTKTRFHPDEYHVHDSNGFIVSVNRLYFNQLSSKFGNIRTEHPYRSGQSSFGDGRRFTTHWNQDESMFTPCFTSHRYSNRVARSKSIFNFKDISQEEKSKFGLYDYPPIYNYHYQDSILGWSDPLAEKLLTTANAKIGAIKQVRLFIIVFHDKSIEAGLMQQNYWKNGNKNEVVVCVGVKNNSDIDWVHPFAWDNENLLVNLREEIANLKTLDMKKVVATSLSLVEKQFKRKEFDEFDYIKLEPPVWAKILCFMLILTINCSIIIYSINNG